MSASVAQQIVKSEVVKTVAKEAGGMALNAISKALPVDVAGVIGAFKGVLDGDVSDEDVGNICGAALGTLGGAIGTIFGSGTVGRMVGDFLGKKVGTALSKFFRGNVGKKARRRRRAAEKAKRDIAMLKGAMRGYVVVELGTSMLGVYYAMADLALEAGLFKHKAIAVGKVLGWARELGWTNPESRPEWQTRGAFDLLKAGADPKLAAKMAGYEKKMREVAAELGAIIASLRAANEAAAQAKRRAPAALRGKRQASDWVARREKWLTILSKGKDKRVVRASMARQLASFDGTAEERFEAWEARMKAFLGRDTGALAPSPGSGFFASVSRPALLGSRRAYAPPVVRVSSGGTRALAVPRPMADHDPLTRRGRLLQWRPLTGRAAAMVRRYAPLTRAEFLAGRETAGIVDGGAIYVVESGDSPWKIAEKLTGSGNNWKQLIAANPGKKTASDGNFKTLFAGERLTLPAKWRSDAADEIDRRKAAAKEAVDEVITVQLPPATPSERIDGLSADKRSYVVRAGDSAWKIAERLTGNGGNWKELVNANPSKRTSSTGDGNFQSLFAGERLTLPARWTATLLASAPPAPLPALPPARDDDSIVLTPDPVFDPPEIIASPGLPTARKAPRITLPKAPSPQVGIRDDAEAVAQAKAVLVAWARIEGPNIPAGVVDYGTRVEDVSPIWGARDRLELSTFSTWWNVARGGALDAESDLTAAHLDALRAWAEAAAAEYGLQVPAPVIEEVPETVISTGPEKKSGGGGLGLLIAAAALAASAIG